ncbi:hypothetical protein [Pedobacter sp. CFBP9032]|uniref:hypothetical protein n=1 Tax=Pedobacter sp. CFBP9032 TaxID=3096539 RepID=UPI002A699E07|nr:hypothetical protein [Pedobacter sp. CFBP9032]MDY0907084.1 hypothetical protein [Pedobacter sp. CFBP9032]
MGNKIATEEDYWMCSGGIMPAQMQSIQRIAEQKDSKKYLIKSDTATASIGDFVCKWVMLIMALIAAVIAVLIVATGGAALGVMVAVGAAAGAAGAAFGSIVGGMVCGQKAAIARTWIGDKSNLMIGGQKTLTTGSTMECPVFGSKIIHAPNIKNWWDALRVGMGNFGETVILGALGGALIGLGGAFLSGAAALSLPTLASVGTNIVGSITGWGMAARLYFGANAVSNQQALGQIDINNVDERDAAFGNAAFPEYGSVKRIASGSAEPMDAMLLLYFLNLRVPGAKPGVTPKEEPAGGNKEEPVASKDEQGKPKEEEVKPVENVKPTEEGPVKGKDGKAYELNKSFDFRNFKMKVGEKLGDFGENVVKAMLESKGFNQFYEVQNKSGNGVDIVARNSKTGEIMKVEVKSTQQDKLWDNGNMKEIPLRGDQKTMGGEKYTNDRLNRAANEEDGYTDGVSSKEAKAANEAIKEAEFDGKPINNEKYDIYVDKNGDLRADPQPRGWDPNP